MKDENIKKTMNKRSYNFSNDSCEKIGEIMQNYNLKTETAAIEFAVNECFKKIKCDSNFENQLMSKIELLQKEMNRLKACTRQTEDYTYLIINVLNSVYRNDAALFPFDITPSALLEQANKILISEKERQKEIYCNNLKNEGEL